MIRVLVVEDSITIRGYLAQTITAAPGLEVVGEAADGKRAIELCRELRPDVVTMDMMLPVMSGLAATEFIMAYFPTPILIVSASTNRGELFKTYEALAAGAVEVIEKPLGDEPHGLWEGELIRTLRLVARIRVITHPRAKLSRLGSARREKAGAAEPGIPAETPRVIAIGASTGGPGAVLSILSSLPERFPVPILLVIHISEAFATALAEWLDGRCGLPVHYVQDGQRLPELRQPGVWMAPPDRHLELVGSKLHLTPDEPRHSCRPSVDVLFESLARELGSSALACLLTGMGRDGAQGLLALRITGATTIAQDEATSVVFGMPGEAVRLGAATHVLPLQEIGPFLQRACTSERRAGGVL